jgi:hypothetical protein
MIGVWFGSATYERKGGKQKLSALNSGGWIRTSDLWVMSPMSYRCSTPRSCHYTSLRQFVNHF